jgi:hypothetical protein
MNTKFSIVFFLIIFFMPFSILAAKSIRKEQVSTVNMEIPVKGKQGMLQTGQLSEHISNPWSKGEIGKTPIPHPDEDGKAHYFHFTRIGKRRFRYFFLISSRLFLIILHVASLLFGYMACLH